MPAGKLVEAEQGSGLEIRIVPSRRLPEEGERGGDFRRSVLCADLCFGRLVFSARKPYRAQLVSHDI